MLRKCWLCETELPVEEYRQYSNGGHSHVCPSCTAKYYRSWSSKETEILCRKVAEERKRYLLTKVIKLVQKYEQENGVTELFDIIFLVDEAF